MSEKRLLAIDIGAGSGRFVVGSYSDGRLRLTETGRFSHRDAAVNGRLYWDFLDIWNKVQDGIRQAWDSFGPLDAVGIDSFAPDFVCFTQSGRLCGEMVSYRNFQNKEALTPILNSVSEGEFWDICGNMPLSFALLPQILRCQEESSVFSGERVIPLPLANALAYLLSGVSCTDCTQASISMLNDTRTGEWSKLLTDKFIGSSVRLPEIAPCAKSLGTLRMPGLPRTALVINIGSHDTAAANYLLTSAAGDELCVNAGTWISVGTRTDKPLISSPVRRADLNNYGLPDGRSILCKLFMGMGFIRQLQNSIRQSGLSCSYDELSQMAEDSRYTHTLNIFDSNLFSSDRDFACLVKDALARLGRPTPQSYGDMARCLYESIVDSADCISKNLEICTGRHFNKLYIGGGGAKDAFLLRLLEERTGARIIKMPTESTVIGNILMQLKGLGVDTEKADLSDLCR